MSISQLDLSAELTAVVEEYQATSDTARLLGRLEQLIAGPIYEKIVAQRPDDARALVILANAYWLSGRGPDAVGELASRAISADPANRGAWHLWALSESDPRARTERWQQVSERFPEDDLAKASFADNAAALAGAESDPVALKLAIAAYEDLLARASHPDQKNALEGALMTLRRWRP